MIYIASDHGGFNLKKLLVAYLLKRQLACEDLGADEYDPEDDYVDYALQLVERVRYNEGSQGIILCRNGVGVNMLVNKFKGIRSALSYTPKHAASSRNDDNSNVLALPADYIDKTMAIDIVEAWLDTPFSEADRHIRRTNRVNEYGQE